MTTETSIYEYAKQGLSFGADRTAIWFYGSSISYGELFEKIDNVADHLYELGVREGTVVTIHLPNCPQAVMAIYAVAKLGGICNMVHALTPEASLREIISFTESELLITHLGATPIKKTIYVDPVKYMDPAYRNSKTTAFSPTREPLCFDEIEKGCRIKAVIPDQKKISTKCASYLHSSGATGRPKTIMLSHSALNNCVENTSAFFENGDMSEQVSLGILPLFHGFGLVADVHRNIHFGSKLVMMARWNIGEAINLIRNLKVTLIVGVPTVFYGLVNAEELHEGDLSSLKYCYTGGDNVPLDLISRVDNQIDSKHHLFAGFGLTEATTMNCVNTYMHYKCGSAGYPVKNTSIAVIKDDGSFCPTGQGELVISSPTLMMGYLKDPESTSKTLFSRDNKLWTRTGDEVRIDEDGFLFFVERKKNIIIHNGYNIFPGEVETVIRKTPGVKDVCVVGVTVKELNTQNVRAVVIPESTGEDEHLEDAIREECLRRLPRYAIPKEIVFVESFPQNSIGKTERKELSKV